MGVWGSGAINQGPLAQIAIAGLVKAMREHDEMPVRKDDYHPNWVMDVNTLFPNVLIDMSHSRVMTHEVMPLAVDRTRLTTTLFFPPARSPSERLGLEYLGVLGRDTAVDDFAILRTMEAGLKSGAKQVVHFHAGEATCRHLANTVDRYICEGENA